MNKSNEIDKLATALAKAQGQIGIAVKDSNNPFFKSKYADLASCWAACREPLSVNGLSVVQVIDGDQLITTLLHSSGQYISGTSPISPVPNPGKPGEPPLPATPQQVGSATTYSRRYALMAIVGIAPDDDDGNAASHRPPSVCQDSNEKLRSDIDRSRRLKGLTWPQVWEVTGIKLTEKSSTTDLLAVLGGLGG